MISQWMYWLKCICFKVKRANVLSNSRKPNVLCSEGWGSTKKSLGFSIFSTSQIGIRDKGQIKSKARQSVYGFIWPLATEIVYKKRSTTQCRRKIWESVFARSNTNRFFELTVDIFRRHWIVLRFLQTMQCRTLMVYSIRNFTFKICQTTHSLD